MIIGERKIIRGKIIMSKKDTNIVSVAKVGNILDNSIPMMLDFIEEGKLSIEEDYIKESNDFILLTFEYTEIISIIGNSIQNNSKVKELLNKLTEYVKENYTKNKYKKLFYNIKTGYTDVKELELENRNVNNLGTIVLDKDELIYLSNSNVSDEKIVENFDKELSKMCVLYELKSEWLNFSYKGSNFSEYPINILPKEEAYKKIKQINVKDESNKMYVTTSTMHNSEYSKRNELELHKQYIKRAIKQEEDNLRVAKERLDDAKYINRKEDFYSDLFLLKEVSNDKISDDLLYFAKSVLDEVLLVMTKIYISSTEDNKVLIGFIITNKFLELHIDKNEIVYVMENAYKNKSGKITGKVEFNDLEEFLRDFIK